MLGRYPPFVPTLVHDGTFYVLNSDRRGIDAEDAGAFARGGADAAGEIRAVIGFVQALERILPQPAIDQIIPFRDEVVDGATGSHAVEQGAGVTERDAAIHAAGALLAQLARLQVQVELVPIADALDCGPVQWQLPQIFYEA